MIAIAAIPVPSSSTRRRYLALDANGGWTITTPAPPADYRLSAVGRGAKAAGLTWK